MFFENDILVVRGDGRQLTESVYKPKSENPQPKTQLSDAERRKIMKLCCEFRLWMWNGGWWSASRKKKHQFGNFERKNVEKMHDMHALN